MYIETVLDPSAIAFGSQLNIGNSIKGTLESSDVAGLSLVVLTQTWVFSSPLVPLDAEVRSAVRRATANFTVASLNVKDAEMAGVEAADGEKAWRRILPKWETHASGRTGKKQTFQNKHIY